jgi:hypothetical protein
MKKTVLLLAIVTATLLMAGCGDMNWGQAEGQSPKKKQPSLEQEGTVAVKEKPKTVMVNEGLSKKEEEKLNERLDELEKKVESQDEEGSQGSASQPTESSQPEQSQAPQAEDQARAAAEAYYEAVAARNWGYTYDHLDSETQSAYTEQEWFAKNDYLADTGAVTYTIESVVMDSAYPKTVADVAVVLTTTDGSTSVRNTYFVYENGLWLHRFSPEEYDLLASAPTASSSATSSASASSSATAPSSPTASPNSSPKPSPNRNDNVQRNGHRRAATGGTKPTAPRGGGDINCDEVAGPVRVPSGDPNNLDGDGDGFGCE